MAEPVKVGEEVSGNLERAEVEKQVRRVISSVVFRLISGGGAASCESPPQAAAESHGEESIYWEEIENWNWATLNL